MHEVYNSTDPEKATKEIFDKYSKKLKSKVFRASCNGKDIGFVCVNANTEKKLGSIHFLFVEKEFRKQNVAKKLIDSVKQYFKDTGCKFAEVGTAPKAYAARHLYESCGFEEASMSYVIDLN